VWLVLLLSSSAALRRVPLHCCCAAALPLCSVPLKCIPYDFSWHIEIFFMCLHLSSYQQEYSLSPVDQAGCVATEDLLTSAWGGENIFTLLDI